jgi:hypothetical protein
MRVIALVSLLFGFIWLMLLDGQVFTHAVQGIICGGVAIACGLVSARKERASTMKRWAGRSLAGFGVLLVVISAAQLPGAYEFQTRFNERSRRAREAQDKPRSANERRGVDAGRTFLSAASGSCPRATHAGRSA